MVFYLVYNVVGKSGTRHDKICVASASKIYTEKNTSHAIFEQIAAFSIGIGKILLILVTIILSNYFLSNSLGHFCPT